jgi:hypothetical protein
MWSTLAGSAPLLFGTLAPGVSLPASRSRRLGVSLSRRLAVSASRLTVLFAGAYKHNWKTW